MLGQPNRAQRVETLKTFLQPGNLFHDLIMLITIIDDGHLLLMLVLVLEIDNDHGLKTDILLSSPSHSQGHGAPETQPFPALDSHPICHDHHPIKGIPITGIPIKVPLSMTVD